MRNTTEAPRFGVRQDMCAMAGESTRNPDLSARSSSHGPADNDRKYC